MFFDETFDWLDPIKRNEIKNILKSIAHQDGTTIVMTSHNLKEVEDICDNMGILTSGNLSMEKDLRPKDTNLFKLQIAFSQIVKDTQIKNALSNVGIEDILSCKIVGRVITIIFKGDLNQGVEAIKTLNPILIDRLNLSLEETFIYEKEEFDNVSIRK